MSSTYCGSQAGEIADTGPVMPWTATDCYEVAHVHAANQPCECPCHDREADRLNDVEHDNRCCMEGIRPTAGPDPDCPGVEALDESRRRDAAAAASPLTPGMVCGPVDHDWQADPDRIERVHAGARDEGLTCSRCGVTEAELDAMEHGTRGTYDEPAF